MAHHDAVIVVVARAEGADDIALDNDVFCVFHADAVAFGADIIVPDSCIDALVYALRKCAGGDIAAHNRNRRALVGRIIIRDCGAVGDGIVLNKNICPVRFHIMRKMLNGVALCCHIAR